MTNNDRIAHYFAAKPNADVYAAAKEFGELVSRVRAIKSAVAWGTYQYASRPVAAPVYAPTIAQQWATYWAMMAAMQQPHAAR